LPAAPGAGRPSAVEDHEPDHAQRQLQGHAAQPLGRGERPAHFLPRGPPREPSCPGRLAARRLPARPARCAGALRREARPKRWNLSDASAFACAEGVQLTAVAMATPFDEMDGWPGDEPREAYAQVRAWLQAAPSELLQTRRAQAELLFRRTGITFNVYGDPGGAERLIPFDLVPRVITHAEWTRIERGLVQRVEALNALLADLYGPQEILRAGLIPEELVRLNPQLQLAVMGHRPSKGVFVHVAGVDLVRTGPDDFFVLEDNARTPSGVSYMLENREMMLRL